MKKHYLRDLESGAVVEDEVFLVRSKTLRAARNGTLYIELELADRSGSMPARYWNATREIFESFDADSYARVSGQLETYRDQLQMRVHSIQPEEEANVDLVDFLPTTDKDIGGMFARLKELVRQVHHKHLQALLDAFFADEEFCRALRRCPAAVQYHHAVLGGLLEHTLSVAELAAQIAPRYPNLNADLLLTGAILHDIGKIDELTSDRSFGYSDAGNLIGHLVLGVLRIEEKARQIDGFPKDILNTLRHLLLSHHGEYEYGSPKLPMSLEAVALHHLDNLDAKLSAFQQILSQDLDPSDAWTGWSRMFERRLYKGPPKKDSDEE